MWRKIAIGVGVALLVVLVSAIGSAAWVWRQATAMPDWADDAMVEAEGETGVVDQGWVETEPAEPWPMDDPPPAAPSGPSVSQGASTPVADASTSTPAPAKKKASRSKRREMRNFHLRTATKDEALRKATRASRAVYQDGQLEAGVILDMSRLSRDDLQEKNRAMYDKALKVFPPLRGTKVYIAVLDQPVSKDGFLQLGKSPRVKIGNLEYTLQSASRRLGLSPKKVRKELNRELRRLKVVDPDRPPPMETPEIEGPI